MAIYGAGFVAVQLVFVLLHLRAYSLRDALGLDARELWVTRRQTQGFVLNALVGLASVGIALLGGEGWVPWAGWAYLLIGPLQTANGFAMGSRWKAKEGSDARGSAGGEGGAEREGSEHP